MTRCPAQNLLSRSVFTDFLLLKSGYLYAPYVSHEKLIEDNKPDYYLALRTSQKTFNTAVEDVVPWLTFFLKIILLQSQLAVDLLSDAGLERTLSPKQLAVWHFLQEVGEATPLEISRHTGIARGTISQAIDKLLRLRKIERLGEGRATRYRLRSSRL